MTKFRFILLYLLMISKFEDLPDNQDMIFRKVRNNIEIGIAPMMYGYNIRANILGEGSCWIDYSAGSSLKEVEDLYSLIISIINKRMDENFPGFTIFNNVRSLAHDIFQDFPRQHIKPMCNDHECFMKLDEMCGPEIISIKLPNLPARKVKHILDYNHEAFDMVNRLGGFDDLLGED